MLIEQFNTTKSWPGKSRIFLSRVCRFRTLFLEAWRWPMGRTCLMFSEVGFCATVDDFFMFVQIKHQKLVHVSKLHRNWILCGKENRILWWSFPRTHSHLLPSVWIVAVNIYLKDFCLSRLRFKHPSFRLRDERSNPLRNVHHRGERKKER